MNNISDGFFTVNPKAGFIRLLFIILCFIIFWSLLAIFFSVINPLGPLNLSFFPELGPSNLAISILNDILSAYFTFGAIAGFSLMIMIFWLSAIPVVNFYNNLIPKIPVNIIKQYLLNCAFSIRGILEFHFSQISDSFPEIDTNQIFPYGPMKIWIDPGIMLIIRQKEKYRFITNLKSKKPMDVSLDHCDEIKCRLNNFSKTVRFTYEDPNLTLCDSPFFDIVITYTYLFPSEQELRNIENTNNLINAYDSKELKPIIETIINMGINQSLKEYKKSFESLQGDNLSKSFPLQENNHNSNTQRRFAIRYHFNSFKQPKIKRNRKLPMYLLHGLNKKTELLVDDPVLIESKMESFASLINLNINHYMTYLLGTQIISARIKSIGEFNFR